MIEPLIPVPTFPGGPAVQAVGTEVSPTSIRGVARLSWYDPIVWILVGGSSHDYGRGRIHESYGPPDRRFFQRRHERARQCYARGCAKRVIYRETWGHWRPEFTQVTATGYEDCPRQMRESWRDYISAWGAEFEIFAYERHGGEGQFPEEPAGRAEAFATNLVASACAVDGKVAASRGIDGLAPLETFSIEAAEIRLLVRLGVRVYCEAFTEQEDGAGPGLAWGHLPALALWSHVLARPPRGRVGNSERIVVDDSAATPELMADFLGFCATRHYVPCLRDDALLESGRTVKQLREMAVARMGAATP